MRTFSVLALLLVLVAVQRPALAAADPDPAISPYAVATPDPFVTADWRSLMSKIPGKTLTEDGRPGSRPRLSGLPIAMERMAEGTFVDGKRYVYIPLLNGDGTKPIESVIFRLNDDHSLTYIGEIDFGVPESIVEFTSPVLHPYHDLGFSK